LSPGCVVGRKERIVELEFANVLETA